MNQKLISDIQQTKQPLRIVRKVILEIADVHDALEGTKQQHRASLYELRITKSKPLRGARV